MSVLDLHPAPWKYLDEDTDETDDSGYAPMAGDVVDANGEAVLLGGGDDCDDPSPFGTPSAKRLILAAPELLAALKRIIATDDSLDIHRFIVDEETRDLVARIEGGK